MRRSSRLATLAVSGGLILAPLALFSPALAAEPLETATFGVGEHELEVPAGITCIQFQVDGASGGDAQGAEGGRGGRTSGWYVSTPGEILQIEASARGEDGSSGGSGGGGINSIAGGDGGSYPDSYDVEPIENQTGGGGGGASLLVGGAIITVAGGGGGAGANSVEPTTSGGDGGDAGQNGEDGGTPIDGNGGTAGGSVASFGQRPDILPEPPANEGFHGFLGGGGGGGGGNGGNGGENVHTFDTDSGGGGGGGGGGTNFFNPPAINTSEGTAPEGDGRVVLTWQPGFTGTCGEAWDAVDPTDPGGDDGDGDTSNAGSTFDTGRESQGDSTGLIVLAGLAGCAIVAVGGSIGLRRRS